MRQYIFNHLLPISGVYVYALDHAYINMYIYIGFVVTSPLSNQHHAYDVCLRPPSDNKQKTWSSQFQCPIRLCSSAQAEV